MYVCRYEAFTILRKQKQAEKRKYKIKINFRLFSNSTVAHEFMCTNAKYAYTNVYTYIINMYIYKKI